ncbi:hypothetical protein NKG05_13395 [Oerskovia sp. M15]
MTVENTIFATAPDGRRARRGRRLRPGRPTTRLLDVATTLLHWAPIGPPALRAEGMTALDAPRRARILTEAYGFDRADRLAVLVTLERRFARGWYAMRHAAATRGGGWQRMWDQGAGERIREKEAWFAAERDAFARELG